MACTTNSAFFYKDLFVEQIVGQANHLLMLTTCGSDWYSHWLSLMGAKVSVRHDTVMILS
jgi:hypothetical protein